MKIVHFYLTWSNHVSCESNEFLKTFIAFFLRVTLKVNTNIKKRPQQQRIHKKWVLDIYHHDGIISITHSGAFMFWDKHMTIDWFSMYKCCAMRATT